MGIVIWLLFALVVAAGARGRGRSGFVWFMLSVVISPLLACILLLLLPKKRQPVVLVVGSIIHPSCAELVRDLQQYRYKPPHRTFMQVMRDLNGPRSL